MAARSGARAALQATTWSGLIAQQDGVTVSVFAFEVAGDRIKRIRAVRNPGKLHPWTTG